MSLSITYADKWQIVGHPDYRITTCGIVYNVKSGKPIKRVYKSRSVGYWLNGQFYTLAKIRALCKPLPANNKLPF